MTLHGARVLVVAMTLVLAVSACGPQPRTMPTPSRTTPTVTPTPEPSGPTYAKPDQVFDGSCTALFSEVEVGEMLGTTATLRVDANLDAYMPQFGGIRCEWDTPPAAPNLIFLVLPAEVLAIGEQNSCQHEDSYNVSSCGVDATSNSIRISGAVQQDGGDLTALAPIADSVEKLFVSRAIDTKQVRMRVPLATTWKSIPDCYELGEDPGLQALLAANPGASQPLGIDGGYTYLPAEEELFFHRSDANQDCLIPDDIGYFSFSAVGGGRWNEEILAALPSAKRETVAGFDSVITSPSEFGDETNIEAFVDDNWISCSTTDPGAAYPILRALVAKFG
jgi:hypothetical protein